MATAIGQSDAVRILIPVNHCNNVVAGVKDLGITELVKDVVDKLSKIKM